MKCPINKQFGVDFHERDQCFQEDICQDETYNACKSLNSLLNNPKAMETVIMLKEKGYSFDEVSKAWKYLENVRKF